MIAKTRCIPDGKKELKKLPTEHYTEAKYLYYPVTSARCPEGETKWPFLNSQCTKQ